MHGPSGHSPTAPALLSKRRRPAMPEAWATHPTGQELVDYGLGKLPAEHRARISEHLAGCPECRRSIVVEPSDYGQAKRSAAAGRPRFAWPGHEERENPQ